MVYLVVLGMLAIALLILYKVLLPQTMRTGQQLEEQERANAAVDTIKKRMDEFAKKRSKETDEVMLPVAEESMERKLSDSEELSDEELLKSVVG
jgi:type II secretory pathway pseudopilin PulG